MYPKGGISPKRGQKHPLAPPWNEPCYLITHGFHDIQNILSIAFNESSVYHCIVLCNIFWSSSAVLKVCTWVMAYFSKCMWRSRVILQSVSTFHLQRDKLLYDVTIEDMNSYWYHVCLYYIIHCQGNYDAHVRTRSELEENQMKRYQWEKDQMQHMKVRHWWDIRGSTYIIVIEAIKLS